MKTASNDTRTRRSCSTPSSQRQCAVKKGPANNATRYQPESAEGGCAWKKGAAPTAQAEKEAPGGEQAGEPAMARARRAVRRANGHDVSMHVDVAVGRVSPSCVSGLWETFFAAWMATFVAACEARLLRPTAADLAALAAPTAEPPERPDPATFQGGSRNVCRVCLCKRLPRTPCRGLWVCVWPRGP